MDEWDFQNDNTYAFNIKDEPKHVSEVERGRKGYYCMGCSAQVEARKGDKRAHHFAHVPSDVKVERKCTYSDETYRHKVAKDILQRIKKIKVPALYKYPPKGDSGRPLKIKDSWTIEAAFVKNERQFYENREAEIKYGQDIDFETDKEKFLLIKPDVAFFDEYDKPILLIEIVATHKIDAEKLSKIRRLGIDTIQVTIPKGSPEEIENCFSRTQRTQWIYNYEQETAIYIHVSDGNNPGILSSDEFQRQLSKTGESVACRSAQIGNLIRGIRKCLESEYYREIERSIRIELARVKENAERERQEFEKLRSEYRRRSEKKLEVEEGIFRNQETEFERKEEEFREYEIDLEARYYRKREELENSQREYGPECQAEIERIEDIIEKIGNNATNDFGSVESLTREESQWENEFGREQAKIFEEEKRIESTRLELDHRRRELPSDFERLEARFRAEFEERRVRLQKEFEERGEQVRKRFEEDRRRAIETVENQISGTESRIERRIKETLSRWELRLSIEEGQRSISRFKQAKKVFESGAYKDWT